MIGLKNINLAIIDSIKRASQQMLLLKKTLVKNKSIASYEKKHENPSSNWDSGVKFEGLFLFDGEEKVELFGSNIFSKKVYAKVYTLNFLNFEPEDQVLVDNNFLEIISVNQCFKNKVQYIVLMLRMF